MLMTSIDVSIDVLQLAFTELHAILVLLLVIEQVGRNSRHSHVKDLNVHVLVDGFGNECFCLLEISGHFTINSHAYALHAVSEGLDICIKHLLPIPGQSASYPNLGQGRAVFLNEGQRMAVVVQPMDVTSVAYLIDGGIVLILHGARWVASQYIAIVEETDHERQLRAIGLPESWYGETLAAAVRLSRSTYAVPPAIELVGLRVNLILKHVEGLRHLCFYITLPVDLNDKLVKITHSWPLVVIPFETELVVVNIENLCTMSVGALWLFTCIFQGVRLTYFHLKIAPLGQVR